MNQISEDGKWRWDGQRWVPNQGPPMNQISEDGKWRWDGQRWVPNQGPPSEPPPGPPSEPRPEPQPPVGRKPSHTGRNVAIGCGSAVVAVIAIVVILVAVLGRGGSSPTKAPVPQQQASLQVVKAGAGGNGLAPGLNLWSAGAMIANPSADQLASNVTVQATAYGSDNKVVSTGGTHVSAIHAGQTLPVAMDLGNVTGPIARVTVHASPSSWTHDTNPKAIVTGTDVAVGPRDGPGHYIVSANLVNGTNRNMQGLRVSAVCSDASGNINDAATASLGLLPASGTAGVQFAGNGPVPDSCVVSAAT